MSMKERNDQIELAYIEARIENIIQRCVRREFDDNVKRLLERASCVLDVDLSTEDGRAQLSRALKFLLRLSGVYTTGAFHGKKVLAAWVAAVLAASTAVFSGWLDHLLKKLKLWL